VEKAASGSNYVPSLDASPRHQEWVVVKNGTKNIHTWVVYPQNSQKSKTVLLIHENKGLTDWVRNLADQIAAE
jgi:carboxymethylenebutenolidase